MKVRSTVISYTSTSPTVATSLSRKFPLRATVAGRTLKRGRRGRPGRRSRRGPRGRYWYSVTVGRPDSDGVRCRVGARSAVAAVGRPRPALELVAGWLVDGMSCASRAMPRRDRPPGAALAVARGCRCPCARPTALALLLSQCLAAPATLAQRVRSCSWRSIAPSSCCGEVNPPCILALFALTWPFTEPIL